MIVLLDPTSDRCACFFQAPILRRPDFLLFQAAMEPFDVAVAFRVMIRRRRWVMPRRLSVSMNRVDVNCVPLSVVIVKRISRLPEGNRSSTACSTAASASSVRQRCERFHPTISRVQQSITSHQVGPAHVGTGPHFRHVRLPDLIRFGCFHAAHSFFRRARRRRERTSSPRSRITRNTRLRFTGSPFFRCSHHATRR